MASRIIESRGWINPRTNRPLTSVKTITNLIKTGVFDVPKQLILNERGNLVINNKKNRKDNIYNNGRIITSYKERFDEELFEEDQYRYVKNVIQNSGFTGDIIVSYVFDKNDNPLKKTLQDKIDYAKEHTGPPSKEDIERFKKNTQTSKTEVHEYTVPTTGSLNTWWNNNNYQINWRVDSEFFIFSYRGDKSKILYRRGYFIIAKKTRPIPRNVIQSFREGISNCLLTPIKEYFTNIYEMAEAKNKKYEINKKRKQIDEFITKFKNGVPTAEIDNITETLKICIKINDIKNNIMIHSRTNATRIFKVFEYINTKLNHVELIHTDKIEVSEEEFGELMENKEEGDYYTKNIITNKKGTFFYKDRIREEVQKWEESQNLDSMEYLMCPEISDVVLFTCHFGADVRYNDEELTEDSLGPMNMIDHVKSYYNYKNCDLYKKYKFSSAPKMFRKIPKDFDFENYNGFWKIENIQWENLKENVKSHLKKLNIYNCANHFNTPELYFMKHELGLTFDLVYGAWSFSNYEIDMEGLLKINPYCKECNKNNKCSLCCTKREPYKTWAGSKCSIKFDNIISLKGSKDMASLLEYNNPDQIRYNQTEEIIYISTKKSKIYHKSHITSYILSYSRIQILRELFKLPFENVRRVQLDGIYYTNLDIPVPENFQSKPVNGYKLKKENPNAYFSTYGTKEFNPPFLEEWNKYRLINGYGVAGSGKSKYFLTMANLLNPCYVAKEHKIIQEKREEYSIKNTSTLQRLLVESYNPADTNTLIIDESSKLNNTEVKKVVSMYPNSLIIFIGDECQLPPFGTTPEENERPEELKKFYQLEFKTNYRCKCPQLLNILNRLRTMILEEKSIGSINKYFIEALKNNTGTDENYDVKEYIICGTHKEIEHYTNKHKNKQKKWLITKTNDIHNAGTILVQEKEPKNAELRHGFTAHATQGITIKSPNKLYISAEGLFCPEMAYTVLSRVEYLNQIVLLPTFV